MSDDDFSDPKWVDKMIRAAKTEPVHFAFVQGSAPDKSRLGVDRHRKGEQLLAALKKSTGSAKGCHGTVTFAGTEAVFMSDHPLAGLEKLITEWLHHNRLSFKARVASPDEAGGPEEETGRSSPPTSAAGSGPRPAADDDDDEDETDEIYRRDFVLAMIKRSRAKPVNFAFGRGPTPEEDLLTMHPRREPKQLAMLIKRTNHATKGAFGTVQVEANKVVFTSETTPPGLKRSLRRLFKEWKLPFMPVVVGPDGEVDEPDDEDAADIPQQASDPHPPAPGQGASGDAGIARLATIKRTLEGLLPRLKELFNARHDQTDEIRSHYMACAAAVKGSDLAGAERHLGWLTRFVSASDGPVRDQATGAPAQAWRDAYAAWQDAKDRIDGQMSALIDHMRGTGDQDLIAVADKGLLAMTNDCFVPARAAFMDFGRAAAEDRPRLAREALKRAAALRAQIEADERVAVCEDNPFGVEVTIRKTVVGALQGVMAVLERIAA